jgi:hypothetical protein
MRSIFSAQTTKACSECEELLRLGKELEMAKKIAPTRPRPDTPPHPIVQRTAGTAAARVDHVRDALSGRAHDNPPDPQGQ